MRPRTRRIYLKRPEELEKMRRAGRLVAETLRALRDALRPAMTTADLNRMADERIRTAGGVPSFRGYRGFPASACISPNAQVVHGIPGAYQLQEGDIVSIDVGAIVDGFHGDSAVTLPVGRVSTEAAGLLRHTYRALYEGIAQARPGGRLGDVSAAIQRYAEGHGYSLVQELVGHGIGRSMHEAPQVPNVGPPDQGPWLLPGMVLAIEPMVNVGGREIVVGPDKWTVTTGDGTLSAHFEHTVAIGWEGPEILTRWPGNEEPI